MWSTLLGLIERWWREKPRLDTVRDIVNLRDAMRQCEDSYRRYVGVRNSMDRNETFDLGPAQSEWQESLDSFSASLSNLSKLIEIFSPELSKALLHFEVGEHEIASSQPPHTGFEVNNFGERAEAILLFASYQDALSQLDKFIRSTFKPEEVLAVQKSRLR